MIDQGLVNEVRRLRELYGERAPAFKAIGYREVLRHVSGELSLDEASTLTIRSTRQYARRQLTWFRREEGIVWFSGHGGDPATVDAATAYVGAELERQRLEIVHAETAS